MYIYVHTYTLTHICVYICVFYNNNKVRNVRLVYCWGLNFMKTFPDISASRYVFNFCRPHSSLNFTDSHEQHTKQQESVQEQLKK